MLSRFTHDLHVHLYGCVEPATVWQLGRERWQTRQTALEWYAVEFAKAYGRTPEWQKYWTADNGLELLTRDYLVPAKTNFARFQASFNLLIALFPLHPSDRTVLQGVLKDDAAAGIRYCEYRTILPAAFSHADLSIYLESNARTLQEYSASTFAPRIALSLPRDPEGAATAYGNLRQWMNAHPSLAEFFVGVDFCGFEENDPALSKKSLFQQIRTDNRQSRAPLAILLHVGETWETVSPLSALRRVLHGAESGAHRLGHATIAGITRAGLQGRNFINNKEEALRDLEWLGTLPASSAPSQLKDLMLEVRNQLEVDHIGTAFAPSALYLDVFPQLQNFVLKELAQSKVVVESCPTSNLIISGLEPHSSHPLKRFVTAGINTVVGRDDPGIFGSSFATEEKFCRNVAGLGEAEIQALADAATVCGSAILAANHF